jgi:hypothetical protein
MQAAGPDPWPGSCACGQGETMNAVTASDLEASDIEAADLPALARLDDDGAPHSSGLPRFQPGRPCPDNDRGAAACRGSAAAADDPGRRRQPIPALMGVGSHAPAALLPRRVPAGCSPSGLPTAPYPESQPSKETPCLSQPVPALPTRSRARPPTAPRHQSRSSPRRPTRGRGGPPRSTESA